MTVNVGVPPKTTEFKSVPADIFEVMTTEVKAVPNKFYDPEKDPKSKETQFQWTFKIREKGEYQGQNLVYFTGATIGRHPRNKLTNLVKVVDKTFDIDIAYKDVDDFIDHVTYKPLRVTTEIVERKDGDGTFTKVSGILPTKMGDVEPAEIMTLTMGATHSAVLACPV